MADPTPDPADHGSIYKAVKRLLENNGIDRARLEAIVTRAATEQIRATLSAWWVERKLRSEFEQVIRELVKKAVVDELSRQVRTGSITVTIGVKP